MKHYCSSTLEDLQKHKKGANNAAAQTEKWVGVGVRVGVGVVIGVGVGVGA